jgi:hypothetical protein
VERTCTFRAADTSALSTMQRAKLRHHANIASTTAVCNFLHLLDGAFGADVLNLDGVLLATT